MLKTCFYEIFTCDFTIVKENFKKIIEDLKNERPDLSDDVLFDLRVIYNEITSNAVIHGNKGDLTKKAELFIELDANGITVIMKDEGNGFNHSSLINSMQKVNAFNEHGRGLQLVLSLADSVAWNDTGNEITICKKF